MKILVTGGAGFIGGHIVDRLVREGYQVTILDNLESNGGGKPDYLNTNAELIVGDIRDERLLQKLIPKFKVIFHEAASVGIAQSNYEIARFIDVNSLGTAKLLQSIVNSKTLPKLIISASNTTYGEGLYSCNNCGIFHPEIRTQEQINKYGFEPVCQKCKNPGKPFQTSETTELNCNSVYAFTKKTQEELSMFLGKLYGFPVVLLKCFNVFGPRQSLSNPYTGVSAIFMSRVKSGNVPVIYEDGLQTRDFVYIDDVVEANILAMQDSKANFQIFNVGSGSPTAINNLAEEICKIYGKVPRFETTHKFRKGDIRHCIADISKIEKFLGWKPKVSFIRGLEETHEWAITQESRDYFEKADSELKEKGLL